MRWPATDHRKTHNSYQQVCCGSAWLSTADGGSWRELLAALDGDVFALVLTSHVPGGCTPSGDTRPHGALARRVSAYFVPAQHTSNPLRLGLAERSIRQLRTGPRAALDGSAFSEALMGYMRNGQASNGGVRLHGASAHKGSARSEAATVSMQFSDGR